MGSNRTMSSRASTAGGMGRARVEGAPLPRDGYQLDPRVIVGVVGELRRIASSWCKCSISFSESA
jgi:hypothetical protein